jgi:Flp pilus assembly protein TadD
MMNDARARTRPSLEAWLQDTQIALAAGRMDDATRLASEALAAGWEHPGLLSLAALKLENEGRLDAARAHLQRAVELAPRDVGAWNALGLCLSQMNCFSEAIDAFDTAIAIAPTFAQAFNNRGVALENLAEIGRAAESFERAAALMPVFVEPLASLSGLALRRGEVESARKWAQRATDCAKDHPKSALALAAVHVVEKKFDAAIAPLEALIASPAVAPWDKVLAGGLLGDALDGLNRPEDAFRAFAQSKARSKALVAHRFSGAGIETLPRYVGWLTDYFRTVQGDGWKATGKSASVDPAPIAPVSKHVFIVGFPRSGTTLIEHVLGSHPDVTTLEEKQTLNEGVLDFLSAPDDLSVLEIKTSAELEPYRRAYWDRVRGFGVDLRKPVFIDKNPLNSVKIPLISKLFPDARILFAIRDPRDVVLSCFTNRFAVNSMTYEFMSLSSAARLYDQVMTLAEIYRAKIGMNEHLIVHERVVADFHTEVRRMCDFIGLEWNETVETFADQAKKGRVGTVSGAQLAKGLNASGIERWRRYEADLSPILPIVQPWVDRFGYTPR